MAKLTSFWVSNHASHCALALEILAELQLMPGNFFIFAVNDQLTDSSGVTAVTTPKRWVICTYSICHWHMDNILVHYQPIICSPVTCVHHFPTTCNPSAVFLPHIWTYWCLITALSNHTLSCLPAFFLILFSSSLFSIPHTLILILICSSFFLLCLLLFFVLLSNGALVQ